MKIRPADSSNWYLMDRDKTLLSTYNLKKSSIVVDIGARHGDWAKPIRSKYGSTIYCFEVVEKFCEELKNKDFTVFQKAVNNFNGKVKIGIEGDEGSIFHEKNTFEIESIKASTIFKLIGHNKIDLMKINVEGAEYNILHELIESRAICQIHNITVQFHLIENAESAYEELESKMRETHELLWRCPFVWENWQKISQKVIRKHDSL